MFLERSRNGTKAKLKKHAGRRKAFCVLKRRIPIILLIIILLINASCIYWKGNFDFAIEINILSTHF